MRGVQNSDGRLFGFWIPTVPCKAVLLKGCNSIFCDNIFRAHTGPVLALTVSPNGDLCFSGGVDSTIRCWNMPSSNIDPYDSFGKNYKTFMLKMTKIFSNRF